MRRGSRPLIAVGLAFGVLLAALSAGVRIPLLGRLPLGFQRAGLDYSESLRGFPPLRDDYVKGVLGQLIGDPQRTALGQRRLQPPAGPGGPGPNRPVPPRSNDYFAAAAQVQRLPYRADTQTTGAEREPGEPAGCGALNGGTVWFRYTAPEAAPLIAHTFGSSYGTALTVYEGSRLAGLRPVGNCHQDLNGNARVPFRARSRATYYFQVAAARLLDGGRLVFHLEHAGVTSAVSVSPDGTPANHNSYYPSISGNGRYVSFDSGSTNLVDDVTYPCPQVNLYFCTSIFRFDRLTGITELVSASPSGKEAGNDYSYFSSISSDGRYVAFMSAATNLLGDEMDVAAPKCVRPLQNVNHGPYFDDGSRPTCRQIYVRDMVTKKTRLVSASTAGRPGKGDSEWPAISSDGRFVAFESRATDIAPAPQQICTSTLYTVPVPPNVPPGLCTQLIVRDLRSGRFESVSISSGGAHANAGSWWPSLSRDGRYVIFNSFATNLDSRAATICVERLKRDDSFTSNPYCANVFVRDRLKGKTEVVSLSSEGLAGNDDSVVEPIRALSADGRFVVFTSWATNLGGHESDAEADVFIRDRVTGKTNKVSRRFDPRLTTDGASWYATISTDGRTVAFNSESSALVPGDTNECSEISFNNPLTEDHLRPIRNEVRKHRKYPCLDVFVFDRPSGLITRVSVSSQGGQGRYESRGPTISDDGRFVVFMSASDDLVRGGYDCGNGGATVAEQYFFASRTTGLRALFQCFGIFMHERGAVR